MALLESSSVLIQSPELAVTLPWKQVCVLPATDTFHHVSGFRDTQGSLNAVPDNRSRNS